jgi:bile acid:Na+ symporter, BASS family
MMLIQIVVFCLLALPLILFPETKFRVVIEAAMICMITPTATAAAVVTGKLGGNAKSLISYTIIINIASSLIVPLVIPIIHPSPSLLFLPSFLLILGKVFPMLIFPFLAARAVQLYLPKWHKKLLSYQDLAFYLWSFALVIAIAVTVRSIMHSHVDPIYEFYIAVVALLCCMGQFAIGRWIGKKYHDRIGGGQSLGQKNTVFSIWLGANFLSPVTALAGGFYTIWHNVVNSYQLYKRRKLNEEQTIAREI